MKRVGAHVSASGGVSNSIPRALDIGANAFALFVKNQKRWFTKPFSDEEVLLFNKHIADSGIRKEDILPHGSYLLNLGSPKDESIEKSISSLLLEVDLCYRLGIDKINIHPGSHLREISEEECLDRIASAINEVHSKSKDVKIVLENTAGQGSNVGYKIEHLKRIMDGVEDKSRVGVCIDTCHAFAAGYDLTTIDSSKRFFESSFEILGAENILGLHLNDSKMDLSSRRDRHESLGKGKIGLEVFKYIMNEPSFDDKPLILETVDSDIWEDEIKMLHSFVK